MFILCWSPYILFDLLQVRSTSACPLFTQTTTHINVLETNVNFQVYQLIPNNQTSQAVATFIQSLAPLNSAANPIIYCMFSANLGKYIRWEFLLIWWNGDNLPFHLHIRGKLNIVSWKANTPHSIFIICIFTKECETLVQFSDYNFIFWILFIFYKINNLYFSNLWCRRHCCRCCIGKQ